MDHPKSPRPVRSLPCVHLGALKKSNGAVHSQRFFACAEHQACVVTENAEILGVRSCDECEDYLPRDPFAPDSGTMRRLAARFLESLEAYPSARFRGRGIVIAGGGEKFFASLYITVRALRHVGCTLPIQVWYLGRNGEMPSDRQDVLSPWNVQCIDADEVRRTHPARILNGWELKVFATLHCPFEEILFLDADCYPIRNPDVLFEDQAYREAGAIFWPDSEEIDDRLKWKAFAVAGPVRRGSVESGQYLLDKRTCWKALNLAWFYNDHSDFYYDYCYGDKHTFEVAWAALNSPYVMYTTKPRVEYMGYMHIGPDHETMFIHRCSDKFRLEPQSYVTPQRSGCTGYHPGLPLENECWRWLGELTYLLGLPFRSPDGRVHASSPIAPSRITLATLFTPEIAEYGEWSASVVRMYAERHGFKVEIRNDRLDKDRPASWSKLVLLEEIFDRDPECEWIMWIDADAVILQPEVNMARWIDDAFDFIVADDSPLSLFNNGVFFVRNRGPVRELLRRAYAKEQYLHHHFWEQAALQEVVREGLPGLRVKIVPRHLFNSFAKEFGETSFIAHFAGESHDVRTREIRRLVSKIWYPMPMPFRPGTNDAWIFSEVATENEYRLPDSLVGKVVLDVGAHIGSFSYACSMRRAAEIWSVEAHPENHSLLKGNVDAMRMPGKRRAIFGAVWGNHTPSRTLRVHFGDGVNRGGRVLNPDEGAETALVVFDELVREITRGGERRLDLLKLDCEAAEFPILYTSRTLNWIDEICAEVHPWLADLPQFRVPGRRNDLKELRSFLEDAGFTVHLEEHHLWAWRGDRR